MNLRGARKLAREGTLYPSLIIHGTNLEERLATGVELARTLLCEEEPGDRPCGSCRHCRRITLDDDLFHPDFRVLTRDLKTATSVAATKELLQICRQAPFEARGQVLVIAEAESLTGGAANALLKVLEEPPVRAPRNFLLLAPAQQDLLPTLRSRSWGLYLGGGARREEGRAEALSREAGTVLDAWERTRSPVYLLSLAGLLEEAGEWKDPRTEEPWILAADAVKGLALERELGSEARRRLLDLAAELLEGPRWRVRGISAGRILEGMVSRHLAHAP